MAEGKVATHLCLTLIVKKLKINVEHGKVITTLNILFSVVPQMLPYDYQWFYIYTNVHESDAFIGRKEEKSHLIGCGSVVLSFERVRPSRKGMTKMSVQVDRQRKGAEVPQVDQ